MTKTTGIIRLEAEGFARCLDREKPSHSPEVELVFKIRWQQIDRIIAYKDDVWAYDIICLGFYIDGNTDQYVFVDEEMEGWNDLTKRLNEVFRISNQWYFDVTFPAFERCERTIWQR